VKGKGALVGINYVVSRSSVRLPLLSLHLRERMYIDGNLGKYLNQALILHVLVA
jgi:hypothetical protein